MTDATTEWSPQQEAALAAVRAWFREARVRRARCEPFRQVFYLAGFAGTGKSTLARVLASHARRVCYAAFTGKAALVMRSKGCEGAKTIHSLIYRPVEGAGETTFVLSETSDANEADLIVIDECSMVDEELGTDLLSFGVPVLVIGDPAQLPPVKGAGFFTSREPDVMLTEVHRQARDNPIIRMSMDVREGRRLALGAYGDSKVILREDVDRAEVLASDQLLVGKNATRRSYNARIRELRGFKPDVPAIGDRLVCLKNERRKGLLNGSLWNVVDVPPKVKPRDRRHALMIVPSDDVEAQPRLVLVHKAYFLGEDDKLSKEVAKGSSAFDFGYALTVHKSQGSQWDKVYLFDESRIFGRNAMNHLYTAITRAAKTITIVR